MDAATTEIETMTMTNAQHRLHYETKMHANDLNHGTHFSHDNTEGYTSAQLATMNAAIDSQMQAAGIDPGDMDDSDETGIYKRACEDVLRAMDGEIG